MSLLDIDQAYRPVLQLTVCATCKLPVASYGRMITQPAGSPVVGIDTSNMELCGGHAIRACDA